MLLAVMLGAPGAGKGTQAVRLAARYGVPAISTGDMLREAVAAGSDLGRRVKAVMEAGELVSDDLMIDIVRERVARPDAAKGFVLDGFPRTLRQAEALDAVMDGRSLTIVNIAVPAEEIVRRLASRRVCGSCAAIADPTGALTACAKCGEALVQRADDREDVVRERLRVYERNTAPLLEYYRARPTFKAIDGLQTPDQVAEWVAAAIADLSVAGQEQ
jgi:adenylate kinase